MSDATLYFFPLSCARIAKVAVERTGIDYETKLINLMQHEQKSPEYLAINRVGKVPALKIGERVLIENVAIILYLDQRFPEAGLLPPKADPLDAALVKADLLWCATTLHPLVRQIRATHHYTVGDTEPVKTKGLEAMVLELTSLDERFMRQNWWFGDTWSIIDTYLSWITSGFTSIGGDLTPFPALAAHTQRVSEEPAYQRMYANEGELMEAGGVVLPPGVLR